MKASLKSPENIAIMRETGEKLSQILDTLVRFTKVGTTLTAIDDYAQELILQSGGKPGFAMVPGYRWATCLNVNEGVVHGIPTDRKLKAEDVISIDIGMFRQGFHTDMSTTFPVVKQKASKEVLDFLAQGELALKRAIAQVKPGSRVGHISQAIQQTVEAGGYSCIYTLTGHGIGKQLHEYPSIPGVLSTSLDQTPMLKPGMALAVEVIYAQGSPETVVDPRDGWTISTQDGKISAVFEKTVAVTSDGFTYITP